jgi:transposase
MNPTLSMLETKMANKAGKLYIENKVGYRTNLWTTARIAEMVEREFGVRYHPDHIGRLMHSLGWTQQKPERRALERYEDQIERWKHKEWPRIKRTLQGWAPISSLPMNRVSCRFPT